MMNVLMVLPLFIGTTELLLIGGMALLLFGGKKLPEMMRGLGQGVKEFKKGMDGVNAPVEETEDESADEAEARQKEKEKTAADGE